MLFKLCCFIFRMRRRTRDAPPVLEAEDEESYQDEILTSEPSVRRRGRGRGRARGAGRRQRDPPAEGPAEPQYQEAAFGPEV